MQFNVHNGLLDLGKHPSFSCAGKPITLLLDHSHRIAFASSAIESWLGYEYEALPGSLVTSLVPGLESFPEWQRYCTERPHRLHKPWTLFALVRHADGRHIPALVSMSSHVGSLATPILRLTPVSQA